MKITLLTPAWPGTHTANGITTAVTNLVAGLKAGGHEISIVAMDIDAPHDDPRVIKVESRPWTLMEKLRARLFDKDMAQQVIAGQIAEAVARTVTEFGAEIVVMEETQGWSSVVQDRVDVPVVVTLHCPWFMHKDFQPVSGSPADLRREAREAAALKRSVGITAPSQNVLEATEKAVGLGAVPRTVVANPIPLAPETPAAERRPDSLLFVGRFERIKGGDTVLEAFERLAPQHDTATLTFVGPDRGVARPGQPKLSIDAALAALPPQVAERVTYTGQLPSGDIAGLRRTHDITLIASRYENLNYSMLEAMACGSAIISTNVGGPAEVLEHERTALLVPPDDPEAMAAACLRLLQDPALAQSLRSAARADIEARFLPEEVGRQMADFLQKILDQQR